MLGKAQSTHTCKCIRSTRTQSEADRLLKMSHEQKAVIKFDASMLFFSLFLQLLTHSKKSHLFFRCHRCFREMCRKSLVTPNKQTNEQNQVSKQNGINTSHKRNECSLMLLYRKFQLTSTCIIPNSKAHHTHVVGIRDGSNRCAA